MIRKFTRIYKSKQMEKFEQIPGYQGASPDVSPLVKYAA